MPDLGLEVLFKGKNLTRVLGGLGVALRISLVSVVISIFAGIIVGMLMTWKNPISRAITRCYLEIVRIMPQMVLLFLVYFGTTRVFGWNLSGELSAVIVFSFWGTAEMGDLVRGAVMSIPAHQYESAAALGLTGMQTYRYIVLPQTVRRLIPLSINLITRMIKTTSLVLMKPYEQSERRLRCVSDGVPDVLHRLLADQHAGKIPGKTMEVSGSWKRY